jgi:hypothetical protein
MGAVKRECGLGIRLVLYSEGRRKCNGCIKEGIWVGY